MQWRARAEALQLVAAVQAPVLQARSAVRRRAQAACQAWQAPVDPVVRAEPAARVVQAVPALVEPVAQAEWLQLVAAERVAAMAAALRRTPSLRTS